MRQKVGLQFAHTLLIARRPNASSAPEPISASLASCLRPLQISPRPEAESWAAAHRTAENQEMLHHDFALLLINLYIKTMDTFKIAYLHQQCSNEAVGLRIITTFIKIAFVVFTACFFTIGFNAVAAKVRIQLLVFLNRSCTWKVKDDLASTWLLTHIHTWFDNLQVGESHLR